MFDGDIPIGDSGLLLRGIHTRPSVGYLSQLESHRLCQVGSYYKTPEYPVWVVGSSSHFTVLFASDMRANQVSSDEQLLSKVQRAFKAVDSEQYGFITASDIEKVLAPLNLIPLNNESFISR